MSTQLRLVDPPTRSSSTRGRARVVSRRTRRAVRWANDWHLDAGARQVGRAGVAAARASLLKAEPDLPRAS